MAARPLLAAGLDTGSSVTRCVVCAVEDQQVRFLGAGAAPSQGWVRGRITDQEAVAVAIRQAVTAAERQAKVSIDGATVGLGGAGVEGLNSRGLYEFGRPREVMPDDLVYAVEQAAKLRLADDRLLLQVFPQDFTIDGRAGYRNPRGTTCSRLEANVHLVTASAHDHQALVASVHAAHLAAEETVFEPLAAAYASVVREERGRGVALVDLGAQSTDLVVYDGDALLLAASLPVSGEHLTRDVSQVLKVSLDDAEQLKREYGCAMLGLTADNSLVEIPQPDGRPPKEASRRELNEVLEARAEELFWYVRQQLQRVGMEQSLLEGVVLTGGGALLLGMCDMAERTLNCQSRNGLVVGIEGWPEELKSPEWTTAAGLSLYSGRLKARRDGGRPPGLKGLFR